tara:strand:- start:64 stop:477 length:414 start_codon:yes stop_codon:yes gene_type:complete
MENLLISGKKDTPIVEFNADELVFRISGNSIVDDAKTFYTPIINWLKSYSTNASSLLKFEFNFSEISQPTLKMLLYLFQEIKSMQIDGKSISVVWGVPFLNNLIKEIGQDVSYMSDVKFKFETFTEVIEQSEGLELV